jgi:ribosome-associated protein
VNLDGLKVARSVVDALEETKAEDILLMDLTGIAPFTDFFVICTGTSERMLKALIHAAIDKVREDYGFKTQVEGETLDGWLLADFGDVVVHVFSLDQREYYALDELWHEGKTLLHLQ